MGRYSFTDMHGAIFLNLASEHSPSLNKLDPKLNDFTTDY